MKKILKKIVELLKQIGNTCISLAAAVFFSKYNTRKHFQTVLNNNFQDKEIYILGNGSSLNSFLDENCNCMPKHIMVVNYFATTSHFFKLKPKHYIMLDNNLCIKADEGNSTQQQQLINSLMAVDWELNLYIPTDSAHSLINAFRSKPNINLVLYNRTPIDGIKKISHILYNLRLGMPRPQNVSNAAVFCAISAGFRTIYLYGIEHSWTKSFDVDPATHRVYLNDGHFYEQDNKRYLPVNDFSQWLLWIHYALESHIRLREYADSIGVKIINKTKQSFVEAYSYDD